MRTFQLACAACVLTTTASVATAGDPLDKPAFTATPAELLAARGGAPSEQGVTILREDVTLTFDERGRAERRTRLVFTIETAAAADDWGTVFLDWRPFYQDQPELRLRVVGPGGDVAELDRSLIHDAPSVKESPTVYSDRRDLTAPLPRLVVGAVVEEEFVVRDREPLLAAGTVSWVGVARGVPIRRKVITISSPAARPATVVTRGALVARPVTARAGGRTAVTYDLAGVEPAPEGVVAAPSDHVSAPYLGVSTGASWAAIATDYRALVEERLTRSVPLPAEIRGPTPRATVDRAVAWLHAHVRYTGIELSDSAIVPAAPADTLARGFGDCKDKATLLVALLRAAGITADVALLSTGPGWDTDPALPGMGDFDHAIVRAVVDGKDVWIDATEDQLAAGQLPSRDQGRRALIVAPGAKALTTTPRGGPADNLIRERRTFVMAEHGEAKVAEASEESGVWSGDLRGWAAGNPRADVEERLTRYVEEEYRGKLTRFAHSDPRDLAVPFTMTIEADHVGRTGAMREYLYAWIFPDDTFGKLPDTFTDEDDAIDERLAERDVDYVWNTPHVYEIVNRFELPVGYSAPDLPARETRALGTLTLTTTRARTPGSYTVTYRLDTGKPRITAAELRASRAAVRAAAEEGGERVVLNLDAAVLKSEGKMREAIAEYRRLAALHPKEALHHGQLALALLDAGVGEAARREARLATTVEPTDGDAWMVLGHVLDRDLIGRQWRAGSDRAGAEAAYRKALALLPTHVGARHELAALLASDADGRPTLDRARLREAVATLRPLAADDERDDRLVELYARLGDADALTELARGMNDTRRRGIAQALAAALRDGGAAALRTIDSFAAGDRAAIVDHVAGKLVMGRHVQAVIALRRAQKPGAAMVALLDHLKVTDLDALPPADPTTPVVRAHARWFVGARRDPPWSDDTERDMVEAATGAMTSLRKQTPMPALSTLDFSLAAMPPQVEGDATTGWRVKTALRSAPLVYYVELRKGRAFLLGATHLPAGLGRAVLDAVKARDLPRARTLLTRLADDLKPTAFGRAFAVLDRHRAELAAAPGPLLELLGAFLLAERAPAVAAPILERCAGLTGDDDRRDCRQAAAGAHLSLQHHDAAAAQLRAIVAADPDATLAATRLSYALQAQGKFDEARAVIDAGLGRAAADVSLRTARAHLAIRDGWAKARPHFEELLATSASDRDVLNDVAWAYLYYDADPSAARALGDKLAALDSLSLGEANTVAAILAEADEPYAAWQRLAPALADEAEPRPADWYVIGRIAESYGLRDDAIAAYRRGAVRERFSPPPTGEDFARRHLKALGVP